MLKAAFNAITRLHSRTAQLKRPGSPDIYSPCRITPSNYFRFQRGPENTTIHGREFIIPIDSMLGQFSQLITFDGVPAAGTFKLDYNGNQTTALAFNVSAANVQTALRLLTGLSQVTVTGDTTDGFTIVFSGFSTTPILILPAAYGTLVDASTEAVEITIAQKYQLWSNRIKRGDKIIEAIYGSSTIDEIIEMVDLGGSVMGFRVHAE